MAMKKVKSFAEYAVKQWMADKGMFEEDFSVLMNGREAVLTDPNGDSVTLVYDSHQKVVYRKYE